MRSPIGRRSQQPENGRGEISQFREVSEPAIDPVEFESSPAGSHDLGRSGSGSALGFALIAEAAIAPSADPPTSLVSDASAGDSAERLGTDRWQNDRASRRSWRPPARAAPAQPGRRAGRGARGRRRRAEAAAGRRVAGAAAPGRGRRPAAGAVAGPAVDAQGEARGRPRRRRAARRRAAAAARRGGRGRGGAEAAAADGREGRARRRAAVAGPAADARGEAGRRPRRRPRRRRRPPAAAKPAAAKAAPAAAAKAAAARELPPLDKITDPKDLAEALRQAGAKKAKDVAAAKAAAGQAAAGQAAPRSRRPRPKTVPPKPVAKAAAAAPTPTADRRGVPVGALRLLDRRRLDGVHRRHDRLHRDARPVHVPQRPGRAAEHDQGRRSPANFEPEEVSERFKAEWGFWIVRSTQYNGAGHHLRPPVGLHPPGLPAQLAGRRAEVQVPVPRQRLLHLRDQLRRPGPRPLERFKVVARRRRPDHRRQEPEVPGRARRSGPTPTASSSPERRSLDARDRRLPRPSEPDRVTTGRDRRPRDDHVHRRQDHRVAGLEERLPPPDADRPAQPGGGDADELLPAPAPGERPQAGDRAQLHLVHGRDDVLPVHRRGGDRRAADVLLPADAGTRLQRHPGPPRRDHAGHPPRAASLGGARDGHRGLAAHVPRVPDRQLQAAPRVQLGRRRDPAGADAAAVVHRLPAAVGPAGDLGHHGRLEHGPGHAAAWGSRGRVRRS